MTRILPLLGHHDRKSFDCGNAELNRWLATVARQHRDKGISSTFVAVETETAPAILGFYSVSIGELDNSELPASFRKKYPQRVPVYCLARLAVSTSQQGRGLGAAVLGNALKRLSESAQSVGGVGVLVDAKPEALGFYHRYGFAQLADNPLCLFQSFANLSDWP